MQQLELVHSQRLDFSVVPSCYCCATAPYNSVAVAAVKLVELVGMLALVRPILAATYHPNCQGLGDLASTTDPTVIGFAMQLMQTPYLLLDLVMVCFSIGR